MLRQDSHHFWGTAAESFLVKGTSSTCSSARVCVIADSLYHSELPQKCFNLHSEATTLREQLFLWLHQKLQARTHWYSWPNKAGFLCFRTTVAAFACAADVVWWRRPDVNPKLIGTSASNWSQQHLTVYLKESSLSNKLYSIHLLNQRLIGVTEVTGVYPSGERREYTLDRSPVCDWTSQATVWIESTLLIISLCLIQSFAPHFSFSGFMFAPTS